MVEAKHRDADKRVRNRALAAVVAALALRVVKRQCIRKSGNTDSIISSEQHIVFVLFCVDCFVVVVFFLFVLLLFVGCCSYTMLISVQFRFF
jgi:hypothetical protein